MSYTCRVQAFAPSLWGVLPVAMEVCVDNTKAARCEKERSDM